MFPLAQERIHPFSPKLKCLFPEANKKFQYGQNPENVSLVRIPVRAVPVGWKLSMTKERRQDQRCFEEKITETETTTPRGCPGFASRKGWIPKLGNKA
jgi:hypothetical protein